MTRDLTVVLALAAIGVLSLISATVRRGRRAARAAGDAVQAVSLAGRVALTAAVITGCQFAVITYARPGVVALLVTLALPALVAATPLVRAMTLTPTFVTDRKGRHRR